MYTVTFYSYKGGVGRSMALLNTAVMLAKEGKRVLLVDFDLEAPGLTSFGPLKLARSHKGLVDYVMKYRDSLRAPSVADFIVSCESDDVKLWVLPAGDHTKAQYNTRLNSIDWERLYSEEHGYLMFEDMKAQWEAFDGTGFDYVFVDSRTGHTDVGGICTRQLPDAVVVMFLPNEQNIEGLVPIVKAIRSEERADRPAITIHFVPSNVPDEFDEDEVLDKMLKLAAKRLGYSERLGVDQPATILHHWSSLDILMQPALALARPKSRLAQEYAELRTAIVASNLADEDGAFEALSRARKELRAIKETQRSGDLAKFTLKGQEIRALHPKSGRIAFSAAHLFNLLKEFGLEVTALTDAIRLGERPVESLLARALALQNSGRGEEAVEDLVGVLTSNEATKYELSPAFRILTLLDESWLETSERLYRTANLNFRAKAILAEAMMTERDNLPTIIKDMKRLSHSTALSDAQRQDAFMLLLLSEIGNGSFKAASLHFDRTEVETSDSPVNAFNLAIAIWGLEGRPSKLLLQRVVDLMGELEKTDANGHQCLALAHGILGNRKAAENHLQLALERIGFGGLVFSCWRYLYATTAAMESDIREMQTALAAGANALTPPFLAEKLAQKAVINA